MEEKPKSIWKKSWTGWRGILLGWLILMVAMTIILLIWLRVEGTPLARSGDELRLFGVIWIAVTIIFVLATCIRCFFSGRNFKRLLFGLACLATLIALFYAEEDWRGWHTWNQFKHEWEAKGEHFDLASVTPAPVPAEQNFALTPIAFTSYGQLLTRDGERIPNEQRDTNFVQRINMEITPDYTGPTNVAGDRVKGKFTNLEGWQRYYRELAATTNVIPVQFQFAVA